MKTYEKPKLIALSISGNNMLCNSCTFDIIAPYNGGADSGELGQMIQDFGFDFGPTEGCSTPISIGYYCKFTSAEDGYPTVINS